MSGTRHTAVNKTGKIISLIKLGEADNKHIHSMWILGNVKGTIEKNKAGKRKKGAGGEGVDFFLMAGRGRCRSRELNSKDTRP